jgi:L-fucose isomerase
MIPKAVWGFNGTERPGAVYLAAALAGYSQKGLPTFGIYGRDVQDSKDTTIPDDVQEKILRFVKAALAAAQMKGKSYLSIGYSSMGIAGSMVDPDFFQEYLGIRTEFVESVEFIRRIEKGIFDQEESAKAMEWTKANCKEGKDLNRAEKQSSRERKDWEWEVVVKMTLIARDLMIGNPKLKEMGFGEESKGRNAILGGFQGQRQWTDYYPNADFTEAILNSSFDWNGIREAFVFATENDSLNGVSMLFGHLLTNTAQIFSDVRTFWSPDAVKRVTGKELTGKASGGIIHLINSGSTTLDATARQKDTNGNPAMKPFWEISEEEATSCLENTSWCPADLGYFRGGGYSSLFKTAGEMPVTMSRVNLVKGIGPVLQIAEGWTVELPGDVHEILDKRTNPTWPTTWFVPRLADSDAFKDVYSVMANWGANHGAISYGHIGADLITLASILRIPVNMHNVSEDKIFRPSAWSAFGTDKEGSDYRACATYGPLYK